MRTGRIAIAVSAVLTVAMTGRVVAEEYYLKTKATDFSVPSNFTVGSEGGSDSSAIPGPDDVVFLPRESVVYPLIAGTENFRAFAQIGEFRIEDSACATFRVNVPSGTAVIDTKFNSWEGTRTRETSRWFAIEKTGIGELTLSGLNKYPMSHAQNAHWNYAATLRVKEGTLSFDTSDFDATEIWTGIVDVSGGATVKVPSHSTKDLTWSCAGLMGAGLITNECLVAGRKTNLNVIPFFYSQAFKFNGAIGGAIAPTFTGENDLRGSRSTFSLNATVSANDADWTDSAGMIAGGSLRRITVVDFLGRRNEASPLGMGNIRFPSFGGELYYDGVGEETDKIVTFQHTTEDNKTPHVINAGDVGGLVWKQDGVYWRQTSGGRDTRVILRGENEKPCEVNCPIMANDSGSTPNFMKRGTGKWVFANEANGFSGAVFVEEGALGFHTLGEMGADSSLGTSERLHRWYDGKVKQSDWNLLDGHFAFSLGCPTNKAAVGVLEYLGTSRTKCVTRPFGLNGTGGVVNNGTGELILGDVTVAVEGKESALYLGGSNALAATFMDVTNGVGSISVVKDGPGTWRLVNNIDIEAVDVRGGTLVLEKTTGQSYTWFRLIQQEAMNLDGNGIATAGTFPILEEFILMDDAGERQMVNPRYEESVSGSQIAAPRDCQAIGAGSLAYGKRGSIAWGGRPGQDRGATNLFDNAQGPAGMWLTRYNGSNVAPTLDDPDTWVDVVLRLPEGAPRITSCDLVAAVTGSFEAELSAWALEGSRNGFIWEPITNLNAKAGGVIRRHRIGSTTAGYYWSDVDRGLTADRAKWIPGDAMPRPGTGYPFEGVVTNRYLFPACLSRVALSGGGTLRIEADVAPVVDDLTVDVATGGTLENVSYAEKGTLTLENVGEDASIVVPGSLLGLDLAGWTVRMPEGVSNRKVRMSNGRICITKAGFLVVVR